MSKVMKDYRRRIRTHEFNWQPEAWTAMEELISRQMPPVPSGKSWWPQLPGSSFHVFFIGVLVIGLDGSGGHTGHAPERPDVVGVERLSTVLGNDPRKDAYEGAAVLRNSGVSDRQMNTYRSAPEEAEKSGGQYPETRKSAERSTATNAGEQSTLPYPAGTHEHSFKARTDKPSEGEDTLKNVLTLSTMTLKRPGASKKIYLAMPSENSDTTDLPPGFGPVEVPARGAIREIRVGAGIGSRDDLSGWELSAEGLLPLGRKIDLGLGFTYGVHHSETMILHLGSRHFWQRRTFVESDVRLFWKLLDRPHHVLRAGAGLGARSLSTYKMYTWFGPGNMEITTQQEHNWQVSTRLMLDYRYYTASNFHLGIQAGMHPTGKNAFYMHLSAGWRGR